MKAIIIGEGTKDTLNAWGVSEELTWSNSFSKLTGNILVIDDQLPQGYMVRTTEQFYHEYMWVKKAGWDDWAPIRRIGTDVMNVVDEEEKIYILWEMAESLFGTKNMKTIHKTLEGAIEAVPKGVRTEENKRELYPPYVANYGYYTVEERILED